MMDQVIMRMQHVRTVAPQFLRDLPGCTQLGAGGFLKRSDIYTHSGGFCRQPTRMSQAIDDRLVPFVELATREINY
jgi:hypothetical protein